MEPIKSLRGVPRDAAILLFASSTTPFLLINTAESAVAFKRALLVCSLLLDMELIEAFPGVLDESLFFRAESGEPVDTFSSGSGRPISFIFFFVMMLKLPNL